MRRLLWVSAALLVLVGCGMSGGGGAGGGSGGSGGSGGGDGMTGGGAGRVFPLLPLAKAKKVAVGNGFACAVTTTGAVRCWGDQGDIRESREAFRYGKLGTAKYAVTADGFSLVVKEPIEVPGITDAVDIAADYNHVCVLTSAKKMKCWGANDRGQIGNGTTNGVVDPYEVPLSNVKKIGVSSYFTCALLEDASVKCWGSQLGLEDVPVTLESDRYSPVEVPYAKGATDLFVGSVGACVVLNGQVRCWGDVMPRAGTNTFDPAPWLLPVGNPSDLRPGGSVSCGIFSGAAKCWTDASTGVSDGLLGTGAGGFDKVPVEPQQVKDLTSGVTGITYAGAVANGKAYRWGPQYLGNGQDPSLDKSLVPVEVKGLANVVQLVTNGMTDSPICAVTAAGSVFCWGFGEQGQIGNGSQDTARSPQKVISFE